MKTLLFLCGGSAVGRCLYNWSELVKQTRFNVLILRANMDLWAVKHVPGDQLWSLYTCTDPNAFDGGFESISRGLLFPVFAKQLKVQLCWAAIVMTTPLKQLGPKRGSSNRINCIILPSPFYIDIIPNCLFTAKHSLYIYFHMAIWPSSQLCFT